MTTTAPPLELSARGAIVADPRRVLGLTGPEQADTIAMLVRTVGQVESMIRTATAWRTELLEAARRAVALAPEAMLAPELAPDTWRGDDAAELAQRALVADVAARLTVHERTAARLFDEADVIVNTLPATAAAMRTGALSYRHAQALVEHTTGLGPTDRARVEAAVLPVAGSLPPGAFGRHVARVRERLLSEPVTVRHERAAARRNVRVDPARDGMAFLTAYLPAATACAVADRLDRAVDVLGGPDEPRTADQLRADVLSALLLDDGTLDHDVFFQATFTPPREATPVRSRADGQPRARATDAPLGAAAVDSGPGGVEPPATLNAHELLDQLWKHTTEPDDSPARVAAARATMARLARGITPHVTVTVPALTLLRTLAGTDTSTGPPDTIETRSAADPPPTNALARAEAAYLDGYGPIDDHTATLLAARAPSFRRLLTHPHTGAVLAVGRDSYTVPTDLRAYLRLRDATCRFPGCSRAATRCDLDHTVAYVSGGTTDATNLAHLCRTHHRLKHATRWTVRQAGTDATLTWTSPTGAEHTTHPATPVTPVTEGRQYPPRTDGDDPPPF